MKTQKILLSGCSQLSRQTMSYNQAQQKFAFCGDSHVYVFDMKDGAYTVETVIPFCKDVEDVADQSKPEHDVWGGIGVYSINFSKASSELLAASALRTGRLEIWDVNQRCFIKSIELFGEDTCIRELNFSPFNPSQLLVVTDTNRCMVIDTSASAGKEIMPYTNKIPRNATTAQWHPRKAGVITIAFAKDEPLIQIHDTNANTVVNYTFKMTDITMQGATVVSVVWNPGENSFLTVLSEGSVFLFAEEYPTPKMYYEKQNTGVAEAVWLDNISGDFLTCSKKVGALRIWNASSPTPKRIIKVSNFGICSVIPSFENHFLLQLVSGDVLSYDLKGEKIRFQTDVCHTQQVQDCAIHPCNPDILGTVSFDGSLRIWDLKTMKITQIFTDRQAKDPKDKILQCLAWYQYKVLDYTQEGQNEEDDPSIKKLAQLVCVGTSAGNVKLIDLQKSKVLWVQNFDHACIYALDWNENGVLAVGPTSQHVSIFKFSKTKMNFAHLFNINVEQFTRCLQFSPFSEENLIAVGTFDGRIVVQSAIEGSNNPFKMQQKISTQRILSVSWSPVLRNTLACGSFDSNVYLLTVGQNGLESVTLSHHQDRVRSLVWNHEIPWMLISAADDQQIAIWDIRTKRVLASVIEPSLALTSFSSHPSRPFRVFSCHFDASVIMWSMLSIPEVALTQMKLLLGIDSTQCVGTVQEAMESEGGNMRLAGQASNFTAQQVDMRKASCDLLENQEQILRFFQVQDGQEEFWAMCAIINGDGPKQNTENLRVNHISDITFAYQTKARDLQQVSGMKMLGTALSKKEDRMLEAANLMIKSGNFEEYCEIQKDLGNFEDAIAVAPKVSLAYWQKCVDQYALHLEKSLGSATSMSKCAIQGGVDQLEEYVDYNILAGHLSEASQALQQAGYSRDAKLLRVNELSGMFDQESVTQKHQTINQKQNQQFKSVHQLGPDDENLLNFTNLQAQKKFIQREPLLSAAIHLSLNDSRRAIQKLMLSNNFEYAFVVAQMFDEESLDQVCASLFSKIVNFGQLNICDQLIKKVKNAQLKEVLEVALTRAESSETGSIRSESARVQPESVLDFICANRMSDACGLAVQHFGNSAKIPAQSYCELYFLSFFDLSELTSQLYVSLLLCYRDVALIKALYFRQFSQLRWIFNSCQYQKDMKQTTEVFNRVSLLLQNENQQLIDMVGTDQFMKDNLVGLEKFLSVYHPAFVIQCQQHKEIDVFRHVTTWLSQSNLSRRSANLSINSSFSGRILNSFDYAVELNAQTGQYISFEEALDYKVLLPFNIFRTEERMPFNPFYSVTSPKGGKQDKKQAPQDIKFIQYL